MSFLQIVFIYIVAINLIAFCVYGIDKYRAKHSKWRISEVTLLGLAVIGGSIGALLGMYAWHHKTKHLKFKYGIPVIIILQLLIVGHFMGGFD